MYRGLDILIRLQIAPYSVQTLFTFFASVFSFLYKKPLVPSPSIHSLLSLLYAIASLCSALFSLALNNSKFPLSHFWICINYCLFFLNYSFSMCIFQTTILNCVSDILFCSVKSKWKTGISFRKFPTQNMIVSCLVSLF